MCPEPFAAMGVGDLAIPSVLPCSQSMWLGSRSEIEDAAVLGDQMLKCIWRTKWWKKEDNGNSTNLPYTQQLILLKANTLQNNRSMLPHICANDEEGAEYHQLCMMRLWAPPLVETLLRCPPCLQRRLQFRNEIKVAWTENRAVRRILQDLPPPSLQKVLDTCCTVACCVILEDYCIV